MDEANGKGNEAQWAVWLEEGNPLLMQQMIELQSENEQLKREVQQLRTTIRKKTAETMSTKLREALRE